jgi:hypothetical protein
VGIIFSGVPHDLVIFLRDETGIETFIETGTHTGQTAEWAAQYFTSVATVEWSSELYEQTSARLAGLKNIKCYCGNSHETLKELVPQLPGPAIFWLDAHWSAGPRQAGTKEECPLLDEIATIDQSSHDDIILIDDARYFLAPPPPPHDTEQWPTIETILQTLTRNKERHTIIQHDYILSVPTSFRDKAIGFTRMNTKPPKRKSKVDKLKKILKRLG